MSPEEQVSRLMTAANALGWCHDRPKVSFWLDTEDEARVFARLLNGTTWGHATIYPGRGEAGRCWLFGFTATHNGVTIEAQGDRRATDDELREASVCALQKTTDEMRAAALAATEVEP